MVKVKAGPEETQKKEGTPIKLKPKKGSKQQRREPCKARTKAGYPCQAPAIEGGLCFCHAHPERLAELGRKGGQKNRRRSLDECSIPNRPLKRLRDVGELLEETINRVRQCPFDLRAANAIGFLAGVLLKALDSRIEDRLAHLEAVMTNRGAESEAFDFRPAKERPHEEPSTTPEDN